MTLHKEEVVSQFRYTTKFTLTCDKPGCQMIFRGLYAEPYEKFMEDAEFSKFRHNTHTDEHFCCHHQQSGMKRRPLDLEQKETLT